MNEQKLAKTISVAKKIEAFSEGCFGVFFFSLGTSYFQEQSLYYGSVILRLIANAVGNVGLAVVFLILGASAIVYGFIRWNSLVKNKGFVLLYVIPIVVGLAVGILMANM